ncbi:hypothetical protein ACQ4PT_011144 [Festuca glaucescens]
MIPLLLLCMAFLEGATALHLCVDRLFNDTQGRHNDGLPHLNPTEEATWMALLPRKLGSKAEFDWLALYRSLTRGGDDHAPEEFLSQASLHDVRLDPGSMYWQGQQTNLEYLLYLDADRLIWSFRQQAGLPTIGEHYSGWEAPDGQIRGHFVGHYLSASAHMWASTHNDTLREKMTRVVDILDHCQKKMNTGYLSAYPEKMFDMYEELSEAWSPYYTIHKIMQGLLDQYTLAGNPKGLKMVVWMTEYFSECVKSLILKYSIQRHWEAMNEETGGLNDVMYQLYTITDDDIAGLHVNTHVPVLIGAQKRYEVVGDHLYKDIATFFFDVVNSSHTFATGGTSTMEHWHDPKRLVDEIKISSNEETCATYNLLKVSRNLFRWTKEVKYADHYERLLINGIMGNQRGTEPGVMIYFLPMGPGRSKSISGAPHSGLPPKMPRGWGGDFLTLTKLWGDDTLLLGFPINLRTEAIKDDRPEYASIQAVLFGPHLLAGLTHGNRTVNASEHSNDGLTPGMWELDARNATSIDDWIVPVPQSLSRSTRISSA